MKQPAMTNHHIEPKKTITILFTERLEQLGYKCVDKSCDRYTTLRIVPVDERRKEASDPNSDGKRVK